MSEDIFLRFFILNKFELSHILLKEENKCFIFGYFPEEYEGVEHRLMLLCTQDMLNTFLANVDDGKGILLETIVKKYFKNKVKVDIMVTIKKLLKKESLSIENLSIFAKEFEKESEDDDITRGFIEKIVVK